MENLLNIYSQKGRRFLRSGDGKDLREDLWDNLPSKLQDRLKEEWPGILSWMIKGCLEWQRQGMHPPPVVQDATKEYFQQEDKIGNWIDECCVENPEEFTTTALLFSSWSRWCLNNNEHTGTKNRFSKRLVERGFRREQDRSSSSRSRGFIGLIVVEDQNDASKDHSN